MLEKNLQSDQILRFKCNYKYNVLSLYEYNMFQHRRHYSGKFYTPLEPMLSRMAGTFGNCSSIKSIPLSVNLETSVSGSTCFGMKYCRWYSRMTDFPLTIFSRLACTVTWFADVLTVISSGLNSRTSNCSRNLLDASNTVCARLLNWKSSVSIIKLYTFNFKAGMSSYKPMPYFF